MTLAARDIVDAGRDASDGAVYVLVDQSYEQRLFVSTGGVLSEQFESGTGQGQTGSTEFWTFIYQDSQGMPVTVEVQKDATGPRMGVVKGAISGKGFDVGAAGDVLEGIAPATAAAMRAQTTQTFHVDYSGADANGHDVVVIAPDHALTLDGFRIFYGPPAGIVEQAGTATVSRGLSIPTTTSIAFTLDGSAATVQYSDAGDSTLTLGATVTPLSASAPPTAAAFLCL